MVFYGEIIVTDYEIAALLLSLKVSFYAILWLLPIATFLAWVMARKQFFGKSLLDAFIHLPLVLPPVVIGYLLLISMGTQGFIGKWLYQHFGLVFSFSWKGAVLACFIVALPLMVRSIRLSIENVDFKLEQAAATLGASPTKVFFKITLPLIVPGVISGTMLLLPVAWGSLERQSVLCLTFPVKHKLSHWPCLTLSKHLVWKLKLCVCALSLSQFPLRRY